MKDSDSSEWKKRRIVRKEKIYECGCGKKYKVYASLETHIKTQHGGVVILHLYSRLGQSNCLKNQPVADQDIPRNWILAKHKISRIHWSIWHRCEKGGQAVWAT